MKILRILAGYLGLGRCPERFCKPIFSVHSRLGLLLTGA